MIERRWFWEWPNKDMAWFFWNWSPGGCPEARYWRIGPLTYRVVNDADMDWRSYRSANE
jgi:hypothetical protein